MVAAVAAPADILFLNTEVQSRQADAKTRPSTTLHHPNGSIAIPVLPNAGIVATTVGHILSCRVIHEGKPFEGTIQ